MENSQETTHYHDFLLKYKADWDITCVHDYNIDIKANHIYLVGDERYIASAEGVDGGEPGVEYAMANTFIRNLNILMRKSHDPILIHLKSCGGDWSEGMALYDAIKACPNKITMLVYTHARSMSSIILQAADKRVMMPNSTFMFHYGSMYMGGTAKQFLTEAEELKKANHTMLSIYVDSMKKKGVLKHKSKQFIHDWLVNEMNKKEEVYMDAKQAVKYGFADFVFGENGYDWPSLLEF